ncbi:hypothetical protein [Candidatus Leptofilum sp.]|uniref:hypothetical protein n=1 Tax=Candidatus Leptofilum sp. TaxID=3241576 RepID=UPI003B5C2562
MFALQFIVQAQEELEKYRKSKHRELEKNKEQIAIFMRQKIFGAHSAVLYSFNLMEAYLNGLAWDHINSHDISNFSNRKKKLLKDTYSVSIRKKLEKYPRIIAEKELWDVQENNEMLNAFLDIIKPFRDSLVHPSPFSAPEKFGGYDKLRLLYRIDFDTGILTAKLLVLLVELIHSHIYIEVDNLPKWFTELKQEVEKALSLLN